MTTTAKMSAARVALTTAIILSLGVAPSAGCAANRSENLAPATGTPRTADWSRVVRLELGDHILVTVSGPRHISCAFLLADQSGLTVQNETGPTPFVETIARKDVLQIATPFRRGPGVWKYLGPVGGYFIGAVVGGAVMSLACHGKAARGPCGSAGFLVGMMSTGIAGGIYGSHEYNRKVQDVIYRAP